MTATSNFSELDLPEDLVRALEKMGISEPTPVQRDAIPKIRTGRDLIIQSRTGTGKTLAFGLPFLADIDPMAIEPQMLVVCPTRELAMQVSEQLSRAGSFRHIASTAVYGGTKIEPQIQSLLYGTHIVVGTPGRLNDLIENKHLKLNKCRYVVLDEADEMLDMGFRLAIEYILGYVPNSRQTVLCSATMPPDVKALAETYMTNPDFLAVNMTQSTPNRIRHLKLEVPGREKITRLIDVLRKERPPITIIFCRTKVETRDTHSRLQRAGFRVGMLQGDMDQDRRTETLERFKAGGFDVLVATDVAARGLDVDNVALVVNTTVPQDPETYVHRSGRTGRAGKEGTSLLFVAPEERYHFAQIEKKVNFEDYGSHKPLPAAAAPAKAAPEPRVMPAANRPAPAPVAAAPAQRQPAARQPVAGPSVHPADWEHLPELLATLAEAPQAVAFRSLAASLLEAAPADELVQALLVTVLPKLKGNGAGETQGDEEGRQRRRRRRRRGNGGKSPSSAAGGYEGDFE